MRTNKNTNRQWLAGALALGVSAMLMPGVLLAQPEGNGDGPPPPPPGDNGGPRGGRGGGRGGQGDNRNLTPEQREHEMQQRRAQQLNRMLSEAGFIDKDVQDAVIAFANAQDAERRAMGEKVQKLMQAVREGEDNEAIAALLADVRADAKANDTKREAALNALDAQIHFKSNARLEAILVLAGLTGEEFGGGPMGGPRGGNRGGGPGGRGGGPGGRGGDR